MTSKECQIFKTLKTTKLNLGAVRVGFIKTTSSGFFISIPKKVYPMAVDRNYLKRVVREFFKEVDLKNYQVEVKVQGKISGSELRAELSKLKDVLV